MHGLQISFGTLTSHIDFLTVKDTPPGLIIGILELRCFRALIDCGNHFLDLYIGYLSVQLALKPGNVHSSGQISDSETVLFPTGTSVH